MDNKRRRPTDPVMVRAGRRIVLIVAAVHIATSIGGFFVNLYTYYFYMLAFFPFLFHVVLTIFLIRGWTMVRYLFAANTLFWAIGAGGAIFTGDYSVWVRILNIPIFLYAAGASVLLFCSKNVSEYMYEKNEGW